MTREQLTAYIQTVLGDKMTYLDTGRYDPMYEVKKSDVLAVSRALRDDENLKFNFICNIGGVDTGENFEVVYSIASTTNRLRLDYKTIFPYEEAEIDSVQEVWPGANWFEREIWELYGININNHGNLKRFLLPDDWNQGFPLRKNWDAPDFIRLPEI